MTRASGFEHACAPVAFHKSAAISPATRRGSIMDDSETKFVAERWSWRAISPWMVPPLFVPLALALALVG
jgi:hypothetical protein